MAKALSGPIGNKTARPGAPQTGRPSDTNPGAVHGAFPHDGHSAGPHGEPREESGDIISQSGGHRNAHMDRANRSPASRQRRSRS